MTPRCSIKGCTARPVRMSKCATHLAEWMSTFKPLERTSTPPKPSPPIADAQGVEIVRPRPQKPLPRRKATGRLEFFKAVYDKWVAEERNHCLECGCWLAGETFNFAHVVGDGESGGNKGAAFDGDNVVPMCRDHHTQMDHGLNGRVRQDMECYPVLQNIRKLIVDRYDLKVRRE